MILWLVIFLFTSLNVQRLLTYAAARLSIKYSIKYCNEISLGATMVEFQASAVSRQAEFTKIRLTTKHKI